MRLDVVFWDWAGTLIVDPLTDFPNSSLIQNSYAFNEMKKDFIISKFSWVLVEKFVSNNIKQVIISNGIKKNILKYLKVNPFDVILTSEEYALKPNTEMLEVACEMLEIYDKNRMIFIGDSKCDELVAENFGIKFYNISNHFDVSRLILKDFNLL